MRLLLTLLLLISSFALTAQSKSIYLQTFVKKDTVQLRWAPTSADLLLRGLKEGYIIERTNLSNQSKQEFIIAPFKQRETELLTSTDTNTLFMTSFMAAFMSKSESVGSKKEMPFFMLSLASSTDRGIANVCGVYYEDLTTENGNFNYSIRFGKDTKVTDTKDVNSAIKSKNPKCTELLGSSRIDLKEVYLEWEAKSLNASYGGYWLYKSEDNKSYSKLNQTPLYFLTSQYEPDKMVVNYVDTAVAEGMTYYYKVLPINHFADLGEESNTVEVYIQRRLNGYTVLDTIVSEDYNRILTGSYKTDVKEDELSKFILYRSTKVDSGFIQIDEAKTTDYNFEFTYKANLLSGDRHYFKVAAISEDKDTSFSFPYYYFTYDQEPPAIPTNLEGVISDSGLARLSWTPPNDQDIQGYRIFRSNSLKEDFVEITTDLYNTPTYTDTLRLDNLTSKIYYKIRAVDMNYNNSALTEPILLMKPDTIAPVAAVLKKYKVQPTGIYLEWANSKSEDLENQYLVRASANSIDTVLVFKNEITSLIDTSCYIGVKYDYSIYTTDQTGNTSVSDALGVKFELGYRPAPANLNAKANRQEKSIELTWKLPPVLDVYSVQIYRSKNEGSFKLYKTLREDFNGYIDMDLNQNNVYTYKIKVVYKTGHSSKMSDTVSVVY